MEKTATAEFLTSVKALKGMTFEAIADKSGVSRTTIHNYFSGRVDKMSRDNVEAIVVAMGSSLAALDEYVADRLVGDEPSIAAPALMGSIDVMDMLQRRNDAHTVELTRLVDAHNTEMERTCRMYEDHIATLKADLETAKQLNAKYSRWHRVFVIETVVLAMLVLADLLLPTFGYIRRQAAAMLSASLRRG